MQATGSLVETDLRSLLENAQSERATGTLTVRDNNGRSATFYFLFGHLFHALSDAKTGDEAVLGALTWGSGDFDFDPKAKLPADETVRSTINDLVVNAAGAPRSTEAPQPAAAPVIAWEPPAPVTATPRAEPASNPPAPAPAGAAAFATQPSPAGRAEPAPPPFIVPDPAEAEGTAARRAEPPQPRRGVKTRPEPKNVKDPIPVPAGQIVYDSLKTSFVDFPRLIATLEREGYTGYVRLLTEDASGLIFFREGTALECVYDSGETPAKLGKAALQAFHDEVVHGHGVLDVVALSPELVDGLHDLTVARPIYSDLYASWVDMSALLDFLAERGLSGSVMVRSSGGVGVAILSAGRLAGAYTSDSRDVTDSAEGVLALCKDPSAVIEVKASDGGRHEPLDVDGVVGKRSLDGEGISPINPLPAATEAATEPPAPAAVSPAQATAPLAPAPAAPAEPPMAATQPPPVAASPPPPSSPAAAPATTEPVSAGGTPYSDTTQNLPIQPPPVPAAPPPPVEPASNPPAAISAPTSMEPVTAGRAAPNWDAVIADLQATTEEALGNRSRKVKDVLAAADRSQGGIESAINQIPTISILFVDSSRLEALAADLRGKLNSYLQ